MGGGVYPRPVLAAGGVDPSGAAGVAQIAGVARMLGVYSTLVPTALVVEDTREGVKRVLPVGDDVLGELIERAVGEIGEPFVAALSMHPRVEEARTTAKMLRERSALVVYDPVWAASAGGSLVEEPRRVFEVLAREADIVLVNAVEAGELTGVRVSSVWSAVEAARALIRGYGLLAVVVKGGHGLECRDVLVEHDSYMVVGEGCVGEGSGAHGTGCVYLGAFAAGLALGLGLEDSARLAWRVASNAVANARGGLGARLSWPRVEGYWHEEVVADVERALRLLVEEWGVVERFVPETGLNIVSVAPLGVDVWAGVEGRVRRGRGRPIYGPVALRASSHLYRAVRSVQGMGATWVRGAVNTVFDERLVACAERLGFTVSMYDRRLEPPEVKRVEGGTIPWGFRVAMESSEPLVPDVVYHRGDWGKEPMMVYLGSTALEAVEKLVRIASCV